MCGGEDLVSGFAARDLGKHRERDIRVDRREHTVVRRICFIRAIEKRRDHIGKVWLRFLCVSLRLVPLSVAIGKPRLVDSVIRVIVMHTAWSNIIPRLRTWRHFRIERAGYEIFLRPCGTSDKQQSKRQCKQFFHDVHLRRIGCPVVLSK